MHLGLLARGARRECVQKCLGDKWKWLGSIRPRRRDGQWDMWVGSWICGECGKFEEKGGQAGDLSNDNFLDGVAVLWTALIKPGPGAAGSYLNFKPWLWWAIANEMYYELAEILDDIQ